MDFLKEPLGEELSVQVMAGGAKGSGRNANTKKEAAKPGGGEDIDEEMEQAINDELEYAGARNITAVRALIDKSKLELGEDGEIVGLVQQIEGLKKSDPYLFDEEADTRGANPAGGGNPSAADSATRMNRLIRGAAKQK